MSKVYHRCINSKCRAVLIYKQVIEALSCPRCKGPMVYSKADCKAVLMGSENHEGWKLEDLLAQVRLEVSQKINKIVNDPSAQAQVVVRNNLSIIEHLGAAEALQRSSYVVLDAMKPNEGPEGKPRIGKDS